MGRFVMVSGGHIRPKVDGSWTAECGLCGNGARFESETEAVSAMDEHLSGCHPDLGDEGASNVETRRYNGTGPTVEPRRG